MTRKGSPLLSGSQTVQSIRDTGYKSTDYAIAELFDNSLQEDAENVFLVLVTEAREKKKRVTTNVIEILVIDDGNGMDEATLADCLAFGGSGRYNDRSGIGRFGMGLSQASVSQATHVDVWSWQRTQPSEAGYTYLDLDEIKNNHDGELLVPYPTYPGQLEYEESPGWIAEFLESQGARSSMRKGVSTSSGTVIRWTNLDRMRWVRPASIANRTEYLLGRVYRRFLAGDRRIKVASVDRATLQNEGAEAVKPVDFRPNDPLYLAIPSDTSLEYWERDTEPPYEKVADEPLFVPFPTSSELDDAGNPVVVERKFDVRAKPDDPKSELAGMTFPVVVRATMVRSDGRPGDQSGGNTKQGKHVKANTGVSMMRAERELLLEQTLVNDVRDRWWGIEVDFSPELDEVFGVTNSKQDAPYFTEAARLVAEFPKLTVDEAVEEGLFDDDHPVHDLWDVANEVYKLSRGMQQTIRDRKKGQRAKTSKSQPGVVAGVSAGRKSGSIPTPPSTTKFEDDTPDPAEQEQKVRESLKGKNPDLTEPEINNIVEMWSRDFKVQVLPKQASDSAEFFLVEDYGNLEVLWLNQSHPGYERLLEPLRVTDEAIAVMGEDKLRHMLSMSVDALGMLLLMWLQMEHSNQDNAQLKDQIAEVRRLWGKSISAGIIGGALDYQQTVDEAFGDDEDDDD